jgi:hypothetical protein
MPTKWKPHSQRYYALAESAMRNGIRIAIQNSESFRWRSFLRIVDGTGFTAYRGRLREPIAGALLAPGISTKKRDCFLSLVRKRRDFLAPLAQVVGNVRCKTRWITVGESVLRDYIRSPVAAAYLALWLDGQYMGVRVDAVLDMQPTFVLRALGTARNPVQQAGSEVWVKWFAEAENRRADR